MAMVWRSGVLAAAYIVLGLLALKLATPGGYATALFPPAGLAMVAALMAGRSYWPAIGLGAFSLNVLVGMQAGHGLTASVVLIAIGIAFSSLVQAGVGAFLLRRYLPAHLHPFRPADMVRFMALGGAIGLCCGRQWRHGDAVSEWRHRDASAGADLADLVDRRQLGRDDRGAHGVAVLGALRTDAGLAPATCVFILAGRRRFAGVDRQLRQSQR